MVILLALACADPDIYIPGPTRWADYPTAPPCVVVRWFRDDDGDGFGDPDIPADSCSQPWPYVQDATDCDDARSDVYPGAVERCDGVDHDCDGLAGDHAAEAVEVWPDEDGDGWGSDAAEPIVACPTPLGYAKNALDCEDSDSSISPSANEVCDDADLDEDCSGAADDVDPHVSGTTAWYPDADEDGYGEADVAPAWRCSGPEGMVGVAGDCDDADVAVSPAAEEACGDGADNDCSGLPGCATGGAVLTALGDDGDPGAALAVGQGQQLLAGAPAAYSSKGGVYSLGTPRRAAVVLGTDGGSVEGDERGGGFGTALAGCDLDADGVGELVASAPAATSSAGGTGVLYAFGLPLVGERGIASALSTYEAVAPVKGVGESLACGDGGDGTEVLVVGSPTSGARSSYVGQVDVQVAVSAGLLGTSRTVIVGRTNNDALGSTVLAPRDLDGDGVSDLVVGAEGVDDGAYGAGAIYRFDGPLGESLDASDASAEWYGEADDGVGRVAAFVGDIGGDGLPDLAVGAPAVGVVYVATGALPGLQRLAASPIILSDRYEQRVGAALLGDLDLDGDGTGDLVVGGPSAPDGGRAWIFLGPLAGTLETGDAALELLGDSAAGSLGTALVSPGDANRDDRDDLLVGDPGARAVHLYLSSDLLP